MKTPPLLPLLLFPLLATLPLFRAFEAGGPMPLAIVSREALGPERIPVIPQGSGVAPQTANEVSAAKEKPRAVRRGA